MELRSGDVVEDYPYLWLRQKRAGETEGRKPRPVCVAVAVKDKGGNTHLALLPISSSPPQSEQQAVALPSIECRRIGLDQDKPAWIFLNEYNYDVAERSHYLKPTRGKPKSLSPRFMTTVLLAFRPVLQSRRGRVLRTD